MCSLETLLVCLDASCPASQVETQLPGPEVSFHVWTKEDEICELNRCSFNKCLTCLYYAFSELPNFWEFLTVGLLHTRSKHFNFHIIYTAASAHSSLCLKWFVQVSDLFKHCHSDTLLFSDWPGGSVCFDCSATYS